MSRQVGFAYIWLIRAPAAHFQNIPCLDVNSAASSVISTDGDAPVALSSTTHKTHLTHAIPTTNKQNGIIIIYANLHLQPSFFYSKHFLHSIPYSKHSICHWDCDPV